MKKLREQLVLNAKNIPGWKTNRKIVVIECDDWGGIRMPSKEVYDLLRSSGFPLKEDRFNKFDTLANKDDLEALFQTLESISDRNGQHPVVTAITNVANPDFKKIRESGFQDYYYEKFTDTILNYGLGTEVFEKWIEGMQKGIFIPELHGREHITVLLWLKYLRGGHPELIQAFDAGFVAHGVDDVPPGARNFRPEFFFDHEDQKPFLIESIKDGVALFREIFDYTPRLFVPGNAIFHKDFEDAVAGSEVRFLNVSHRTPYPDGKGGLKYQKHVSGQKNRNGLIYYVRNCAFEPSADSYQGIELTLRQVAAAFRWGKPAIISTHRVNFVGAISPQNREKGLNELQKLLQTIVNRWPDVEFMNSADALGILSGSDAAD